MEPSQQDIDEIYSQMENGGWDTASDLKWGFFFFSEAEDKLKDIYSELADHDYSIENVRKNEDGEWILQVSKVEALAPDKLFRRCVAFNELAAAYGAHFDGWDVEKNV